MIEFGDRRVGQGEPCYVIAEAGVNHNGDLDVALELVRKAADCGADAVKFQTFKAERVATVAAPKAAYQLLNTNPGQSQIAMLKPLELSEAAHARLIQECEACGIQFLSTPYSFEDVVMLDALGVVGFKVASGQIVELAFLDEIRRTGKPALLSTGMASLGEVEKAIGVFGPERDRLVVLQCTTNYPSPASDANIRAMITMRDAFGVMVGYSDHTLGPNAAIASVALGAQVVEKHFTLDVSMPGPDHSSSMEPVAFKALVEAIREVEAALGSGVKRPTARELVNRPGMRRSIVAVDTIPAGVAITRPMLTFKRPGTGISPADLDRLIGRVTKVSISADEMISWGQVEL